MQGVLTVESDMPGVHLSADPPSGPPPPMIAHRVLSRHVFLPLPGDLTYCPTRAAIVVNPVNQLACLTTAFQLADGQQAHYLPRPFGKCIQTPIRRHRERRFYILVGVIELV